MVVVNDRAGEIEIILMLRCCVQDK